MGPVGRRQERRVIRHAADQALTAPIFAPPGGDVAVIHGASIHDAASRDAETRVPPPSDLDERWDDPDEGWFGGEQFAEPDEVAYNVPVPNVPVPPAAYPSTVVFERPLHEPPPLRGSPGPTISVRPVPYGPTPWYRTKPMMVAFAVAALVAVAAVAVWGILHVLRSPGSTVEESTAVASSTTTTASSAGPASTSAGPPPSSSAPGVPLPPPPPGPTASQMTPPPATGRNSWPRSAPSQTAKPEIGVTRTPVTRAPISAKPPVHQAPGSDSSTPGDGPPKRRGGWPF